MYLLIEVVIFNLLVSIIVSLLFGVISFLLFFVNPILYDSEVSYVIGSDVDTSFKVSEKPFIIYIAYTFSR